MSQYTILVDFRISPGAMDRFMALVLENARLSLAREPDCLIFDVLTPGDGGDQVLLYEVYRDRRAFDAHVAMPHVRSFGAAVAPLTSAKTVTELKLCSSPHPDRRGDGFPER